MKSPPIQPPRRSSATGRGVCTCPSRHLSLFTRHQGRPAVAFTLIEVLVASAVLSILMVVMFAALSTSLSLWRNTDSKIVADREARAVQLLLAQDLAGVVLSTNVNLWPRLVTNGNNVFLQFLTLKPVDYQAAGNPGDVCYVEYTVSRENGRFLRLFYDSGRTFTDILGANSLRGGRRGTGVTTNSEFQLLGANMLADNRAAVRGLTLAVEANSTNFVVLGTNSLPFQGTPSVNNYPAAIEVNFAVTDPVTLGNPDLVNNPNYILRNAGLYSFRARLPRP